MGNEADARHSAPPPAPPHSIGPGAPLSYASPGAHEKPQWITDDGPGGRWLVGCLIVLSVVGVVATSIAAMLWFFVGF